jgi:hypothetical protein
MRFTTAAMIIKAQNPQRTLLAVEKSLETQ